MENPPGIKSLAVFAEVREGLVALGYGVDHVEVDPPRLVPPFPSQSKVAAMCGKRTILVAVLGADQHLLDEFKHQVAAAHRTRAATISDCLGKDVAGEFFWADPLNPNCPGIVCGRDPFPRVRQSYPLRFDADGPAKAWPRYGQPGNDWGSQDKVVPESMDEVNALTVEQLQRVMGMDPDLYKFSPTIGGCITKVRTILGQAVPATVTETLIRIARDDMDIFGPPLSSSAAARE